MFQRAQFLVWGVAISAITCLAACGSQPGSGADAPTPGDAGDETGADAGAGEADADAGTSDAAAPDAGSSDADMTDAGPPDVSLPDTDGREDVGETCTSLALRCWAWPDAGPDEAFADDGAVEPLTTMACGVLDAEAHVVPATLTLVGQPTGSSTVMARPLPDGSAPVFIDAVGPYSIEAMIDDPFDASCATIETVVMARPTDGLYVQLAWVTPGDPDETDEGPGAGADLQLHLVHPNGCWFDDAWDVRDVDQVVAWGDPERTDDDGTMRIRDDNGGGPEVIAVTDDDARLAFLVGVAYVDDFGFGPTMAELRIFEDGALAFDATLQLRRGDFWAAGARGADGAWSGAREVGTITSPPACAP